MRVTVLRLLTALRGTLPEPVYEFGAWRAPWQRHRPTPSACLGVPVIGCDLQAGDGVDRIEDLHALSLADATVGTALVLDTLEHVARPWAAMRELARVLRPGGLVLATSHLYFPLHPCPDDFWRFTPQGLASLATHAGLTMVTVGQAGVSALPHTVVLLASRPPGVCPTLVPAIVDEWLRHGAQTWRERVFNLLPAAAVGLAYRVLQRLDRGMGVRDAGSH